MCVNVSLIVLKKVISTPKYVCLHNTTRRPINQELFTNVKSRLIIGIMDKITKVNVEGDEYGFVAGQTVKGVSGALSSDYVKHIILPEGAEVVEGMLIAVTFVNDNTAGYSGEKTVWSTDGINFYWDSGYTQLITLPPQGCYTVTATETQYEYKLSEYPVLVMGAMTKPFCDSRGHPAGGKLWQAGDTVTVINLENRFIALQTTVNEIIQGSSLPVTSGAVYEKCNSLEPVDEVTSGNMHSVTSNAVSGVIVNLNDKVDDINFGGLLGRGAWQGEMITNTYPPRLPQGVIKNYDVYDAGGPYRYGLLISFGGLGGVQLFLGWNDKQTSVGQDVPMFAYMRSWRDIQDGWTAWKQFAFY